MITVPESLADVLECGKQYYTVFHVPDECNKIKAGVREYARQCRMATTSAYGAVRSELVIWLTFGVGFVQCAENHTIHTSIHLPYDATAYTPETVKAVIDDAVQVAIAEKFIPSFDCHFQVWDSENNKLLPYQNIDPDGLVGIAAVITIPFP